MNITREQLLECICDAYTQGYDDAIVVLKSSSTPRDKLMELFRERLSRAEGGSD